MSLTLLLILQIYPFNSPILIGPDFYGTLADETCDPKATSSYAMMVCAHHRFVSADARMSQVYKQALNATKGIPDKNSSYDVPDISKLVLESQRAWATSRQSLCIAQGSLVGAGHDRALTEFSCMADEADRRTEQLRKFAP